MTEHAEKNTSPWQTLLFYLCAIGIGTSGMMGFISFIMWLACSTFHDSSHYPLAYPFSIICGFKSFWTLIALIVLWIRKFIKQQHKLRALGLSFLLVLSGCACGYYIISILDMLSDVLFG